MEGEQHEGEGESARTHAHTPLIGGGKQHVAWLPVPVGQRRCSRAQVLQLTRNARAIPTHVREWQRSPASQFLGEGAAQRDGEHEGKLGARLGPQLSDAVDGDNVGVAQLKQHLRVARVERDSKTPEKTSARTIRPGNVLGHLAALSLSYC